MLLIMIGLCLLWGIIVLGIDPNASTFLIIWSIIMCFICIFFLCQTYVKWSFIFKHKYKAINCSENLYPIFKYNVRNHGMKKSNQAVTYLLSFLGCLLIWALGASLAVDEEDRYIPLFLAGGFLSTIILTFRHLVFSSVNIQHMLVRKIFNFPRLFEVYSLAFGPLFGKKVFIIYYI